MARMETQEMRADELPTLLPQYTEPGPNNSITAAAAGGGGQAREHLASRGARKSPLGGPRAMGAWSTADYAHGAH
eukprot:2813967-Pyramimonas_sp.AAC.1